MENKIYEVNPNLRIKVKTDIYTKGVIPKKVSDLKGYEDLALKKDVETEFKRVEGEIDNLKILDTQNVKSIPQDLTERQKSNARKNIDVYSKDQTELKINQAKTELTTEFDNKLEYTKEQLEEGFQKGLTELNEITKERDKRLAHRLHEKINNVESNLTNDLLNFKKQNKSEHDELWQETELIWETLEELTPFKTIYIFKDRWIPYYDEEFDEDLWEYVIHEGEHGKGETDELVITIYQTTTSGKSIHLLEDIEVSPKGEVRIRSGFSWDGYVVVGSNENILPQGLTIANPRVLYDELTGNVLYDGDSGNVLVGHYARRDNKLLVFLPPFDINSFMSTSIVIPLNYFTQPIVHAYGNKITNFLSQLLKTMSKVDMTTDTILIEWSILTENDSQRELLTVPSLLLTLATKNGSPILTGHINRGADYWGFTYDGHDIYVDGFLVSDINTHLLDKNTQYYLVITDMKQVKR